MSYNLVLEHDIPRMCVSEMTQAKQILSSCDYGATRNKENDAYIGHTLRVHNIARET